DVITNGRIEKLMPPWEDALNEEERRAVAEYAYSLADETPVAMAETPLAARTATSVGTPEPDGTASSEATRTAGIVEGRIENGTEGATTPDGLSVVLFVMSPVD